MSNSLILNLIALAATFLVLGLYLQTELGKRARIRRRLQAAVQDAGGAGMAVAKQSYSPGQHLLRLLSFLGQRIPLFNSSQRKEMRKKLTAAGYRQSMALPVLMGISCTTALLLGGIATLLFWSRLPEIMVLRLGMVGVAVYFGILLPRIVLDRLVQRRQLAISNSFPDALDLMVICANAGLGLNATIQRVAIEMELLAPELTDEFSLTAAQLQLSGDPAEVLQEMAERIDLDSLRSLASTLVQSRQYGTPISDALRVLAASERTARRMRTEEAAAKLSAKMTLPIMLFILPTVLLVMGAPAVLGMMAAFGK